MTRIGAWRALASGERLDLDAAEAARLIEVLRLSVLDGLPVRDAAELARRVLASVPGAPALWGPDAADA